jgi:RIO kinase 1
MEDTLMDDETFEPFFDEGLITDVIRPIKGGKEASVFLCRAGSSTGTGLLAAKVYRSRDHRSFKNDAVYKEGRVITKRRVRVAVQKKTRFGRGFDEGWWVSREHEALTTLHPAGADVPRPMASSGSAILMEYLGDEDVPAPQLRHVALDGDEAASVFARLMWNVETALARNVVHADLSSFNVLYWEGRATVIDFPQFVDPRTNPNAPDLLRRDIANLCTHFRRYGLERDPEELSQDLWTRFLFAEL